MNGIPVGPQGHAQFWYEGAPAVFFGRSGWGPLRAALDTSILIDLGDNGPEIVEAAGVAIAPEDWDDRVPALRDLITVWMWRDVRFHVSVRQLEDAKRRLTPDRRAPRERMLDALAKESEERNDWGEEPPPAHLPLSVIRQSVDFIRPDVDRQLVQDALATGCHVFLTEDYDDILRHADALRRLGIAALRPADLLDELLLAGELGAGRWFGDVWPDNHGWVHLIEALGTDGQ